MDTEIGTDTEVDYKAVAKQAWDSADYWMRRSNKFEQQTIQQAKQIEAHKENERKLREMLSVQRVVVQP